MNGHHNMSLEEIEFGFQIALRAAWEAYMEGSIPIGAAVLKPEV